MLEAVIKSREVQFVKDMINYSLRGKALKCDIFHKIHS